MGINTFKIGAARQAVELTCDSISHGDNAPRAWLKVSCAPSGLWAATTVAKLIPAANATLADAGRLTPTSYGGMMAQWHSSWRSTHAPRQFEMHRAVIENLRDVGPS